MEREAINYIKKIFGRNFIGIDELGLLFSRMGLSGIDIVIPELNYSIEELEKHAKEYILILGISEIDNTKLSLRKFREIFGIDSNVVKPCFYNQDWYLKEEFLDRTLENTWYLIKKEVLENSHSIPPEFLLEQNICFPSAILCAYTFFANYFANNDFLWYNNFIWCNDVDHNGDRIYVGKYHDADGINKDGFSIHRYLTLRNCYCSITVR